MTLSADLLEKLVCPKCRGAVTLVPDGSGLACPPCGLLYEIHDDMPNMVIDQALPLVAAASEATP